MTGFIYFQIGWKTGFKWTFLWPLRQNAPHLGLDYNSVCCFWTVSILMVFGEWFQVNFLYIRQQQFLGWIWRTVLIDGAVNHLFDITFIFPVSTSSPSCHQHNLPSLFHSPAHWKLLSVFRGHIHSLMKGWEVQTHSWASHSKYTELKSALWVLYCFYRNGIRESWTGPVFPRGFKYRSYITKPNRFRFVL